MKKVKLDFYTENDLQFIHELLSDPETKKYFPIMYTTSIEQSNLRLQTRLLDQECGYANRFLIKDALTEKPVGEISGKIARDIQSVMELAIIVQPQHRGQGFAKLATIEFMKHISNHNKNIDKFRLEIADKNYASLELARTLKFDFSKQNNTTQYWEKDAR